MRVLTLLIAGAGLLLAGPFRFSGSVNAFSDRSFVDGSADSLVKPNSNLGIRLSPTLFLWNVPVGLDLLLSTQESNLRQALNKYRIFLHPKDLLRDVVHLPGLAFSIHGIEVGNCNPSFSPLTLSGVPVFGGAIELNPWLVYLAATGGQCQRAIEGSDTTEPAYRRMLYAGKFGFGKKEGTHFYLTGLHVQDDPNSITHNWMYRPPVSPDTVGDTLETVTPEENYLLGAEFNLALFNKRFTLQSEVAGSELTRDNRVPIERFEKAPDWVENTFRPRLSSGFDYAYSIRPALNISDTRVYGSVRMIGPGYQSLGLPSVRNDIFSYGGGIERSFLNQQVSLAASFTREHDNLIGMKLLTSSFVSYAASLSLNFSNLPSLQVSYSPSLQSNSSRSERTDLWSASTGYSFVTGTVSHSPGLSFSYQNHQASSAEQSYTALDVGLSHDVSFESPLNLSASGGWGQTLPAAETAHAEQRIYFDLAPSYTFFQTWQNRLSLGGTFETGAQRYDVGFNSSFPVWGIADADLRVQRSMYRGRDGDYNEWRLSASLSRSW
jgi:hypothetical protein